MAANIEAFVNDPIEIILSKLEFGGRPLNYTRLEISGTYLSEIMKY
jgi:hypothetical protein